MGEKLGTNETLVRSYSGIGAYREERSTLAAQGWNVETTFERRKRRGFVPVVVFIVLATLWLLTDWIGFLIAAILSVVLFVVIRPGHQTVVTYIRPIKSVGPTEEYVEAERAHQI